MNLSDLASAMNGRLHPEDREVTVSRAVIDSREAGPKSLFFALKGETRDGHDFVDDVLAEGGCAVIARGPLQRGTILVDDVERAMLRAGAWRRELITCPVVGVTGSSGKTTTRELIMSALRGSYVTAGTQANLNNHLGLPLTLLNMPEEIEAAVLEMGMNHPGELLILGEVARPDITVVTNVGIAHMEFFESRDDVARAKAELLLTTKRGGVAVIPMAEPLLAEAALSRDLDVITIGEGGDLWLGGTDDSITAEPFGADLTLALVGRYNRTNALFAIAVARVLGVEPGQAIERMSLYSGITGRGRVLICSGVQIMDESYNANPDSTRACLRALAGIENGRIAVLGDMLELGEVTTEMHLAVLKLADSIGLKALILTGRHYAAASSCLVNTEFVLTGSWREALHVLRKYMSTGDTVLVKGSHSLEMNRIVASFEEES
jgi:UDP-N-acetylmuramoyl-tripeptide--D-alanyl-D-alanine ligase